MEPIPFTCALLLIAIGLCPGVTGLKPKLTPDVAELFINEGKEIRIECQGEGKLQFSTQELTVRTTPQSNFTFDFDEKSGAYVFIRPNATASDTGWYACAQEGVEIENDEQTIDHPSEDISWIYVYVNSSEPFAVGEALSETISVFAGQDVVIPCRPTSPDLPVILERFGIVDSDVPYDPKIGFILRDIGTEYSGETYTCKLDGSLEDDTLAGWPFYTVWVEVNRPLGIPTINKHALHHVVWGEDMTLECTLSGMRGSRFSMNWTIPSSILNGRLHYSTKLSKNEKNGVKDIWKTELTVKNVQPSDGGVYTCVARSIIGQTTNSSVDIKIWDPSYTYVNVIPQGDEDIRIWEKDSVLWKIIIDTYPQNFKWDWYKDGVNIIKTNETDPRSKYSHSQNGLEHFFKISSANIEDSGRYTIHVYTSYNESSITLPLTVLGPPSATIINNWRYYVPGEFEVFSAQVDGSPLPNVTWSYVEYPEFPSKTNFRVISLPTNKTETVEKTSFRLMSHVNLIINMTGDVICKACNDLDCIESTQSILVSEVAKDFGIQDPGIVTEGDNIKVICAASRYNYTDKITWKTNDSEEIKELDPLSERMSIIKKTSPFTWQAILHIRGVAKSDSGDYLCEVVNQDEHNTTEVYPLRVEDARPPVITYTTMNESEIPIVLPRDKNKAVTLECRADGRPVPVITWYKNKELLKESKQYRYSSNNTRLQISFFSDADADSGRYLCRAQSRTGSAESYMDIKIAGKSDNTIIWLSLICVLIVIIIIVITYMAIKVHRERVLKQELFEAGLTHFQEGALECLNPDLTVDEQAELLPYDKKWEFPREMLKLGKQLGSGAFGVVMKAEARGICVEGETTTVAVKMVRRSADPSYMKALSSELKIMIHLGRHLNVVNLLGACTKTILTKRELYVIVEYCRYGNLHNYLQRHRSNFIDQIDPATQKIDSNIGGERLVRSESIGSQNRLRYAALSFSRSVSVKSSDSNSGSDLVDYRHGPDFGDINMSPDGGVLSNNSVQPGWRSNYRGDYKDHNLKPICTQDLLCWAWQVARGMEYLSARNVLHGDLAARNILLADDNIVKICDFGLAKNMYKDNNYKKKGDGPLPIKWMAVESIRDRIFSTQSDVWSYGIVLWEFFTLARSPYPGMEAEKQYDRLIEGYRMEKPEYATDEIYEVMLHCWKAKPSLRPLFPELAEKIGTLLTESVKMHYLDLNTPYMHMNTVALQDGQSDYLTMMSAPTHDYHNSPDPVLQGRPDSAYLSMSPISKSDEPGIFSPRSELEESRFNFPPPAKNTPINSDSEDCIESAPMLTTEDPYMKPIDVQQRRAEFMKQRKEQVPIERDSGYCNVPTIPQMSNSNGQSSDVERSSEDDLNGRNLQKNNNKLSPAIISGSDNYVNMPQQKGERLKDTVDSFSNPSYVIMSNSEEGRQFV